LCDDGDGAPEGCQVRSAACSHSNVQTLLTFMKNAGPLPVSDAMALTPTNPPSIPVSHQIALSTSISGVFHPPRG
jgi:hypothetical protein